MSLSKVLSETSPSSLFLGAAASAALLGGLAAYISTVHAHNSNDQEKKEDGDEEVVSPGKQLRDREEKKVGRTITRRKTL